MPRARIKLAYTVTIRAKIIGRTFHRAISQFKHSSAATPNENAMNISASTLTLGLRNFRIDTALVPHAVANITERSTVIDKRKPTSCVSGALKPTASIIIFDARPKQAIAKNEPDEIEGARRYSTSGSEMAHDRKYPTPNIATIRMSTDTARPLPPSPKRHAEWRP